MDLSTLRARLLTIVIWAPVFGSGLEGAAAAQVTALFQDAPGFQAEAAPALRLVDVRTEPELPSFGEPFQLRVVVRMPGRAVAFLPDTLPASDAVESFGIGSWKAVPVQGDSVEIRATYPLMAFEEGSAELPEFEAWLTATNSSDLAPEAAARSTAELGVDPSSRAQRYVFQLGTTPVAAFLPRSDGAEKLQPRPAAGVAGGSWNVWLFISGTLFAALALGGAWIVTRRRRQPSAPEGAPQPSYVPPREEALRELDRILARGCHRNGRTVEFYRTTTDTLRRFAERTEPAWGRDLTSTELVAKIQKRGSSRINGLNEAVRAAEWVKFGSHRPDPESAEKHWEAIRSWIAEGPRDEGGKSADDAGEAYEGHTEDRLSR